MNKTKIYFASDFHLGIPNYEKSLEREKRIVRWLDEIKHTAKEIYLAGDVFDFWFEYKKVVPRGFVRLLGKIAELSDSGITIHYFTGNHDMWIFDYLPHELGVKLHHQPVTKEYNGKKFCIGHGDGLGPGDGGYKFIKKIFRSKVCQWLFAAIHPDLGMRMAHYWSRKSRIANGAEQEKFHEEKGEWLIVHCKEILKKEHFDFFIFGHRHLPLDYKLSEKSRYINLGEWVNHNSYAVFDGTSLELKYFKG